MNLSLQGTIKISYESFQKIPYDGLGHHLVNGVHIVTPAPSTNHQVISAEIFNQLTNFVKQKNVGKVLCAPLDVKFSELDGYQPDIIFISKNQLDIIKENRIEGSPILIIEITSPDSAKDDYGWKKDLAKKFGVKEYWVVDTNYKVVQLFNFENDPERSYTFANRELIKSYLIEFEGFNLSIKDILEV